MTAVLKASQSHVFSYVEQSVGEDIENGEIGVLEVPPAVNEVEVLFEYLGGISDVWSECAVTATSHRGRAWKVF